jgi:hypothetical protein
MRLHFVRRTMQTVTIGLLAPFFLLGAVTVKECPRGKATSASYTWDFAAEANNLFDQFKFHNQSLIDMSDSLATASPGRSWKMHAWRLEEAKRNVNEMNEILCRLGIIKPAVEPWQAKLIDRLSEDAVLAAIHVEAAIEYLNNNQTHVENALAPVYLQHLEAVSTSAHDLQNRLEAYKTLASAQKRVQAIESAS